MDDEGQNLNRDGATSSAGAHHGREGGEGDAVHGNGARLVEGQDGLVEALTVGRWVGGSEKTASLHARAQGTYGRARTRTHAHTGARAQTQSQ